jgi:hypothetical protein
MGTLDKERDNRRTTLIAKVELSWKDRDGTLHIAPAVMEDTSRGGACLRVAKEFQVGTRVMAKRRTEQFSGVVKYCRIDGDDRVIGVQRDNGTIHPQIRPMAEAVPAISYSPSTEKAQNAPVQPASNVRPQEKSQQTTSAQKPEPRPEPKVETQLQTKIEAKVEPRVELTPPPQPAPRIDQIPVPRPEPRLESKVASENAFGLATSPVPGAEKMPEPSQPPRLPKAAPLAPPAETPVKIPGSVSESPSKVEFLRNAVVAPEPTVNRPADTPPQNTVEAKVKDKTFMEAKWLHLPSRRRAQPAPEVITNLEPPKSTPLDSLPVKQYLPIAEKKEHARAPGSLLSLEDVYRAGGVVSAREGYSINKVVEMLENDHIRDLSDDVKRASVMMALDANGISVGDVLEDARLRLDVMGSYETNQRNLLAEFEARKANENAHIQAELERETARYLERITQNLSEVAVEKENLARWQTTKQREAQRISEAVSLCTKRSAAEPPAQQANAATTSHGLGVVGRSS